MKSTVVDESLSYSKPMYCSREYQASTRLSQQYEKSTSNDHFTLECPNIPTDEEPDYDDAGPASLQMLVQNYYPIDSEGEVKYVNL